MDKADDNLDELAQRIKFLKKEKQKIIDSRKAKAEIQRLEKEIKELNNNDEQETVDNNYKLKLQLDKGSKLIKQIASELRSSENKHQQQDASEEKRQELKIKLESEIDTAKKEGGWTDDEKKILNDAMNDQLEKKWKDHKSKKDKALKEESEKDEKNAEVGLLGCLGVLAWFFPFFWPFLIVQLFRTYPGPCYTILGVIVFLVVILLSMGS